MDLVIGISVLQPVWISGLYRLWFKAQKGSGETSQGWIFIHDKATPGMPTKMPGYGDGVNSIWQFTRRGNQLDCSPSINWISWGFHNSGQWSTEYVEMPLAERAESKAGPEPTRYSRGSAIHHDINLVDQESGRRLIQELKEQGILL